jgi:hypothetical protein
MSFWLYLVGGLMGRYGQLAMDAEGSLNWLVLWVSVYIGSKEGKSNTKLLSRL